MVQCADYLIGDNGQCADRRACVFTRRFELQLKQVNNSEDIQVILSVQQHRIVNAYH